MIDLEDDVCDAVNLSIEKEPKLKMLVALPVLLYLYRSNVPNDHVLRTCFMY